MTHIKRSINSQYICDYCERKFRNGLMPAYCILNNLIVHNVPDIVASLNIFEKILIQRAKVSNLLKWELLLTKSCLKDKSKREDFSFTTSLTRNRNYVTININHELYISVRSIPTKSKIT